jgi:hypothetical protein
VQESGSFQTTQKVPKKSDFFGKIGFLKPCPRYPRNPIFLEKSDFSNRAQAPKKSDFFGKIGFLKPCAQTYPRNPIFLEKSDFF